MSFIQTVPRGQLMLPCSIDNYVSSDNIVRFIDAFVDKSLSNSNLIPAKQKSSEGRPGYSPDCLYKILIYGYLNSISSSRKLENETNRNLELIWLTNNLHPDHWTISEFRKEHKDTVKHITIDFRKFLKDSGYLSGKRVSTDGTKIKAYASRQVLSLKLTEKKLAQAGKEIERYFNQLQANDAAEDEQQEMVETTRELENKIAAMQREIAGLESQKSMLESSNRDSLAPADPQAKLMKTKDGFLPCYNVQTIVDNDSHLILSCEATDYPNDYHSLEENIDTLGEQTGIIPETVLADGGYANEEQIQSLEKRGIECIVPFVEETEKAKQQRDNGINFTYQPKEDCFICSQGKKLPLTRKRCKKKNKFYDKYQCKECAPCPKRELCTQSSVGRIIYRRLEGEWLKKHKEKMKQPENREKFKARKCVAEHPFGTMKYYMGQIPILLTGKQKVQVEMDLYSTAYNLKRILKMDTVENLLKKLDNWLSNTFFPYFFLKYHFVQLRFC